MNRRAFLKTIIAVPLAAVVAPKLPVQTSTYYTGIDWDDLSLHYMIMHPAQKRFYESIADDVFIGGYRGGRTTWSQIRRSNTPMWRTK